MKSACEAVLILAAIPFQTQDKDRDSAEAEAEDKARVQKIAAELRTLKEHPWGGTYYSGDGLGVNYTLTLAPEAGFAFRWRGCLGVYDRNWGRVVAAANELKLKPELPTLRRRAVGLAPSYFSVAWGKRRYLVDTDEIVAFCNAVNAGDEPRKRIHGSFLLRLEDWKIDVEGRPDVPEAYRPWLLARPILAAVTGEPAVEVKGNRRTVRFTMDAGADRGVREGMVFHVSYRTATVTRVLDRSSEVEIEDYEPSGDPPAIKAGTTLSTRP